VKKNIPVVLAHEVRKKNPGVVGISTVTDPYQPLERKYAVTRYCLEQLLHYGFPAHVQTKSALVIRDIDLLTRFTDSQVMISIGTIHDHERRLLEPYTSSIHDRISALQTCAAAGLKTAVFFGPVYPTTRIDEIPGFLDMITEVGVQELWIDNLHLKPGIWGHLSDALQQDPEVNRRFVDCLQQPVEYYTYIRDEVLKQGKQRNLHVIDAF